jgi:sporulation protein YlmC with PRC-barrel domain
MFKLERAENDTMAAKSKLALAGFLSACLLLAPPLTSHAVTIDEMVQETMGAPVYASDGYEVGKVLDVSVGEDGEIDAVRFKTAAFLGFGERVLALSNDYFTVLRGAVVVDLPAEAIESLRPTSDE